MGSVVQRVGSSASGDATHRCERCGHAFPEDYRLCPHDGTPLGPREAVHDPLAGIVVGGTFRLLRPLARGGMARLYEAEHLRVARRFAVKVLNEAYAERPELVTRFEREARALAPLRSPHVVDVVDVLRTPDDRPCIVTGLLTGEDLGSRLSREGRLPTAEALRIALEMCRGLDAAHAHGVVHRDLKPSNVFLSSSPDGRVTVKLVDFGVAKLLADPALTQTDAVVGTPAYMAPEQARGAAWATEASDVYGVGAVMYHMLSGRPPYPDADATAVLHRVLTEAPPRLRTVAPTVPEPVEAVVQAAMARDPQARLASAGELHRRVRELMRSPEARVEEGPGPLAEPPATEARTQDDHDTYIARAGFAHDTGDSTRSAPRARPLLLLAGMGAIVGAGVTGAILMGIILASLRLDPSSRSHGWLVSLTTLTAGGVCAWVLLRRARDAWPSAVAVERLRRRWVAALVAGTSVLGASMGILTGASVLSGAAPGVDAPGMGLAVSAACVAAIWAGRIPRRRS